MQLGLREKDQSAVFLLLELSSPSYKAMGEVSSMDVSLCGSGEGCHLFGHGGCLGSGLGEVFADGCLSVWVALVN